MPAPTTPTADTAVSLRFSDLALSPALLAALADVGYETPSPIQAATIPPLLAGRDVLGQAQTGTGKTAAFALPVLSRLRAEAGRPQALVLAPTRELAIQVAEAFQRYATHIPGFHVLPIYGGQSYTPQLAALRRGVHVVVGTPGRVIDHLERGSLDLSGLSTLVLDEADEMLRMGFIDDVETVLKKTPPERQVALFSATMPPQIRRIAQTYLRDPEQVTIQARTTTAANIRQRYWLVSGVQKLDAVARILEAEPFDAMIVFARTKTGCEELAQKLLARGFAAAAIHGDVQQAQREKTVAQLKAGVLDILVATDVAARGLDVERISHVLNYDIPYDTESYVHRIGRTGRAGRSGEAILFVTPRERGMLRAIERATRQPITPMELPTIELVNDQRVARFLDRITGALAEGGLELFRGLIDRYEREHNVPAADIAAALAKLAQGRTPLLLDPDAVPERGERTFRGGAGPYGREAGSGERSPRERPAPAARAERPQRAERPERVERPERAEHPERVERPERAHPESATAAAPARAPRHDAPRPPSEYGMERFRIEVGHAHGVKPANIVGAIANEAGLDARHIGRIDIQDDHSIVDLPEGMPRELMAHLKKVWVSGQQLRISRLSEPASGARAARPRGPQRPQAKSRR
ncbi:DEAD/DEAH box helicase [Coralloluteibacterium thermophilus]|uniref:ATP-dependent RNA helicase DeaD n=1 Tax=Coralloluteibacterium thermophilum TaxID=2707049 RepID=A0ABV9NLE2_9GAMM